MIKSVICIIAVVVLLLINTIILFLKPEFNFAQNDEQNYCVFYQKWIRTAVFTSSVFLGLFCVYFSVQFEWIKALILLTLVCILVVTYSLCKYKCVTVNGDKIRVERLFRKDMHAMFDDILKVGYTPNARLTVYLKKKRFFDVSFNSENFRKFYNSLLANNVKFKTGHIPKEESCVCLLHYKMTICFPKTMFREYYQSKNFFRNSHYLFSARSLENHEYIEAYSKESGKEIEEFTDLVKNDLKLNGFAPKKEINENINGFDMKIVKSVNKENKDEGRIAYIYLGDNLQYLVIYADYPLEKEAQFMQKINDSISHMTTEDTKKRFVKIN